MEKQLEMACFWRVFAWFWRWLEGVIPGSASILGAGAFMGIDFFWVHRAVGDGWKWPQF
jgi:hypothetical protein